MISKVYIRYREDLPDGCNLLAAADGFTRLGVKVVPFYGFGDVETLPDLGPTAAVCGYICDVNAALDAIGVPRPELPDYPAEFRSFLGREIRSTTLGEIKRHPGEHVFIKPKKQKLFTGLVWDGSPGVRLSLATYDDETPVWACDVVNFVSEYRAFGLGREILDVKRYRGDWSVAPDRATVEAAFAVWKSAPAAFSLDWGVTGDGRTLLIEANDATSLGHYGLNTESYARMIEARWLELVETPREDAVTGTILSPQKGDVSTVAI